MSSHIRRNLVGCLALCLALGTWPASASADGGRIVVTTAAESTSSSALELVDPATGAAQFFAGPNFYRPSWSHDASRISFQDPARGIVLKPAVGGAERVLLPSVAYATLSPTGDEIAYFVTENSAWVLKVTTLDGQSTRTLTQPLPLGSFGNVGADPLPAWSPDAKSIAFPYQGYIVSVSSKLQGPMTPIVPAVAGTAPVSPSFAPDGKRLAYVRYYNFSSGFYERLKLTVRSLENGAETTVFDHVCCLGTGSADYHGPQSWSPDGTQIAYAHETCTQGVGCDSTVNVVNADGTEDHALMHRYRVFAPAWSAASGPVVTIQAPASGARLTGREAVGASEQQLRVHVESEKPLTGVCYAVQTDPTPVPDQQACTNASGPANAPFEVTTDLRPLIDAGTIKEGENIIRVWAYDQDGARGSAEVKVVLAPPNYYVKHVEVAQALSPPFGALPANPLQEASWPLPWTSPSFAGFPIPLIGGRSTLLRIYVGDATLEAGKTYTAAVHYKVTAGARSEESDQTVAVTAADVAPAQSDRAGSINVWLPGSVASNASTLTAEVEVNAGQATPECKDCFPHGNKATVSGIAFEQGGTVRLRPVPILLRDAAGKVYTPRAAYDQVYPAAEPYLPVADRSVSVAAPAGSVVVTIAVLDAVKTANPSDEFARCVYLLDLVVALRAVSTAPAGERWVGIDSPPDPLECNGIANMPGTSIVLNVPRAETLAHELGHSVGLNHTLSLAGEPADAAPLPYVGIGVVGYEMVGTFTQIYAPLTTSDLMGYDANNRWTSPSTWFRMHQGILGDVTASASARTAAATRAAATPAVRRLVSGYISDDHGVIFSSLVAPAHSPAALGPVAGKVVALDGRGRTLASAKVTGTPVNHDGSGAVVPFVIALPPTAQAASLALQAPNGKRLATLRRSRHRPSARFVRLPRRTSARKRLKVRWKASDADRDRLTVTLLARRGKAWHAIALGPATNTTSVLPRALGRGARLRLRLLVSDGFTTTRVDAKPVIVRG